MVAGKRWKRKDHSQVKREERERVERSEVEEDRGGKEHS